MKTIIVSYLCLLSSITWATDGRFKHMISKRLNMDETQIEQFENLLQEHKEKISEANHNLNNQLSDVLSKKQYDQWLQLKEKRKFRKNRHKKDHETMNLNETQRQQVKNILFELKENIHPLKEQTELALSEFLNEKQIRLVIRKAILHRQY